MLLVIPARHLKLFAKIIQCIAKIGDDLYLDVKEDKLAIRTLNNARSAFVSIVLNKNFFESFEVLKEDGKYQLKAKPCHAILHNVVNVEKCTIRVNEEEQRLVFDLSCKRGIKKTSKVAFEQSEALQAIYSKESCPIKVAARPKQLVEGLPNFHSHLDEISVVVSKDGLRLKSHADEAKGGKILHTELHMDHNDFEEFSTDGEVVEVTFSLKEFKAIVSLCEAIGQPCVLHIERSGRPMLLTTKYFNLFDADFVLATLVTNNDQMSSQGSSSGSAASSMSSPQYLSKNSVSPMGSPMSVNNSGVGPMDVQDDEYVAKSPGSSPKKKVKTSNFSLSRVLGGRDLDEDDSNNDKYDEFVTDDDQLNEEKNTIPSSIG